MSSPLSYSLTSAVFVIFIAESLNLDIMTESEVTSTPVPFADAVFIIFPVVPVDTLPVKVYSTYRLFVPSLASNINEPVEKTFPEIIGVP